MPVMRVLPQQRRKDNADGIRNRETKNSQSSVWLFDPNRDHAQTGDHEGEERDEWFHVRIVREPPERRQAGRCPWWRVLWPGVPQKKRQGQAALGDVMKITGAARVTVIKSDHPRAGGDNFGSELSEPGLVIGGNVGDFQIT